MTKMILCDYCICEQKSRGEHVFVGDMKYTFEESMEKNIPCEWCDEYDDLYEVEFND